MRIDIYCRVVDNFGDAGVCWRLARQLAHEFGVRVRLSCDRPELVVRLATGRPDAGFADAAPGRTRSNDMAPDDVAPDDVVPDDGVPDGGMPDSVMQDGVMLQRWPEDDTIDTDGGEMPDAIVAAFQCELPAALRARLRQPAAGVPLWINLDYLSAERWVTQVHGRPSHKPAGGVEWFFMPGFDEASGGLIRELNAAVDAGGHRFELPRRRAKALAVSVFCYPQAPLDALCTALSRLGMPVDLYLAAGVPTPGAGATHEARAMRDRADAPGAPAAPDAPASPASPGAVDSLRIHRLPWLSQPRFDAMLRACDLNFVRGEDSWLRAIWAGKPFVWMPYRQPQQAHQVKLEAFLERLAPCFEPAAFAPLRALAEAWNGIGADDAAAFGAALTDLSSRHGDIGAGFVRFRAQLSRQSELATRLIEFVRAHRPLL